MPLYKYLHPISQYNTKGQSLHCNVTVNTLSLSHHHGLYLLFLEGKQNFGALEHSVLLTKSMDFPRIVEYLTIAGPFGWKTIFDWTQHMIKFIKYVSLKIFFNIARHLIAYRDLNEVQVHFFLVQSGHFYISLKHN